MTHDAARVTAWARIGAIVGEVVGTINGSAARCDWFYRERMPPQMFAQCCDHALRTAHASAQGGECAMIVLPDRGSHRE